MAKSKMSLFLKSVGRPPITYNKNGRVTVLKLNPRRRYIIKYRPHSKNDFGIIIFCYLNKNAEELIYLRGTRNKIDLSDFRSFVFEKPGEPPSYLSSRPLRDTTINIIRLLFLDFNRI